MQVWQDRNVGSPIRSSQDRLTVETTLEVAAYLREARHEPGCRFAWSPTS